MRCSPVSTIFCYKCDIEEIMLIVLPDNSAKIAHSHAEFEVISLRLVVGKQNSYFLSNYLCKLKIYLCICKSFSRSNCF